MEIATIVTQGMVFLIGILALGTSIYQTYEAALALRAKRRAQREVALKASIDYKLEAALKKIEKQPSSPEELQDIVKELEQIIEALSAQDQKFVRKGLHQESKAGAKRFLKEIAAG